MVNVAIQENHEDDYADSPPSMARSSLLRDLPTTERGLRTRAALIAAARKVFERMGYLDARLTDITRAAKCSAGTFYTYFSSKEEIFAAVLEVAQEDMLHPGMPHVATEDDPAAIIEASNRAYLQAYQRNAKLMGLLEQVANVDPEFRELRTLRSNAFVWRNARSIARLQANGQADPDLDPLLARAARDDEPLRGSRPDRDPAVGERPSDSSTGSPCPVSGRGPVTDARQGQ